MLLKMELLFAVLALASLHSFVLPDAQGTIGWFCGISFIQTASGLCSAQLYSDILFEYLCTHDHTLD